MTNSNDKHKAERTKELQNPLSFTLPREQKTEDEKKTIRLNEIVARS